jgi:hypothetical protein
MIGMNYNELRTIQAVMEFFDVLRANGRNSDLTFEVEIVDSNGERIGQIETFAADECQFKQIP